MGITTVALIVSNRGHLLSAQKMSNVGLNTVEVANVAITGIDSSIFSR